MARKIFVRIKVGDKNERIGRIEKLWKQMKLRKKKYLHIQLKEKLA